MQCAFKKHTWECGVCVRARVSVCVRVHAWRLRILRVQRDERQIAEQHRRAGLVSQSNQIRITQLQNAPPPG